MGIFRQFLYPRIPHDFLLIAFIIYLCGVGVLLWKKKPFTWYSAWSLLGYLFVLFSSTVVFRSYCKPDFDVYPFWSYIAAVNEGKTCLLAQCILNVVLFLPLGMMAACVWKRWIFYSVLLYGALISAIIEISQYLFEKGVAEFDDVFHNTLGCIIGFYFIRIVEKLFLRK